MTLFIISFSIIVLHIHLLYLISFVRNSISEVILAVGSSGDHSYRSYSNRAEYFYPNENRWKSAGKFPGVGAVYLSPVLYVENMFIMFGGLHNPRIEAIALAPYRAQPGPSNIIMKLDEGTKKWTKLGLLNQERSSDKN